MSKTLKSNRSVPIARCQSLSTNRSVPITQYQTLSTNRSVPIAQTYKHWLPVRCEFETNQSLPLFPKSKKLPKLLRTCWFQETYSNMILKKYLLLSKPKWNW